MSEDTRWCVEWFSTYGFEAGPFGKADQLARSKNTSVAGLERAGVLRAGGNKVRLLPPGELPAGYDPEHGDRVSEWAVMLYLAKRLREQGADETARLMAAARPVIDLDVVHELAYLLFSVSEKYGWPDAALLFNALGTSWPELDRQSRTPAITSSLVQGQLGFGMDAE